MIKVYCPKCDEAIGGDDIIDSLGGTLREAWWHNNAFDVVCPYCGEEFGYDCWRPPIK